MASTGGTDGREKLGYLGLGLMGIPMTRRLLDAGHQVTVWNRSPGKAAGLVAAGAKPAATPRELAANAGIIFTCLIDAAAVEVAHDTSTPVPMTALAAQLFRMAKAARGADADALEIYKLSEKKKG